MTAKNEGDNGAGAEAGGEKTETPKRRTIGDVAKEAIRKRCTNEEALQTVKAEFVNAKTTIASINWYRNTMRKEDKTVPSSREINAERATKAKELKDAEAAAATAAEGEGMQPPDAASQVAQADAEDAAATADPLD